MNEQSAHELFHALNGMIVSLKQSGILDEHDPLLSQSFVEGETQIPEIVAGVIRSIDDDMVLATGLKTMIDEYQKRKSRIEERVENKRGLIELALMRAEVPSLETPAATVSLRAVPIALGEVDEAAVPSEFFDPGTPKLNRKRLLEALKSGASIDGAKLTNGGQTLSIRRH